jgi:hypothetical protein
MPIRPENGIRWRSCWFGVASSDIEPAADDLRG